MVANNDEPLHDLRLRFLSVPKGNRGEWDDNDEEWEKVNTNFNSGAVYRTLSAAHELRTLKLRMPSNDTQLCSYSMEFTRFVIVKLRALVGTCTWPNLRKFAISNVSTSPDELASFLLRHRATLRYLSLANIHLTRGTWSMIFSRIGGNLPSLRRVRLRGLFKHDGSSEEDDYDPTVFALSSSKTWRDSASMERGIMHGADWPRLLDEVDELSEDEDASLWNVETPAADYDPDGSWVSYGSDDFDECSESENEQDPEVEDS